ncbi:FHA domain-containing protein [Microcystis aeruginosa]|uniref:FHA domain-containing protein n=1 Tax=Microcystis aeruginosa TaxID=1126 RepID=UPI00232CDB3F|nr:FHA domain-containing protein [Microcystis aeruginosa]MDB9414145.1 FHA domain-containing protein [Microcystis aeruginosa CS-567/02]
MAIVCKVCGYDQNPQGAEYCDACGAELTPSTPPTPPRPVIPDPIPEPTPMPIPQPITETITLTPEPLPQPITPAITTTARLIAKHPNAPVAEFFIDGFTLIGIFDSDTGPVDVDLEKFPDNETVSRNHAEIYPDGGTWKIKDLGSLNGVFIKPIGQTRFNARITAPTPLSSGDEIAIAKIRFLFQTP